MGKDIIVMMQGHQIVNLGRANRYTVDGKLPKEDELDDKYEEELAELIAEMQMLAAYSPKNLEELNGLKVQVQELVEVFAEKMMKIGRQAVLTNILSDDQLTHKFV